MKKGFTYYLKLPLTVVFCFLAVDLLLAQDLSQTVGTLKDRLGNQPISLSGNLSGSAQFNAISGMLRRRDPLNMNLFGQLNVNVLGISAPLSISMADGNTSYSLPAYSFVGISPSYKWARLHLFRRSMQFSNYTLSDHGFNGVGFEISPGKFRAMGMLGTLRKARLEDYGFRQQLDPFHKRLGYTLKVGYENQDDHLFATVFKASDDEHSLNIPDSSGVTPQENIVISGEGKKKVSEFLTVAGEYAFSVITPDKRLGDRRAFGLENMILPLMQFNATSKSSSAYNFMVDFSPVKTWVVSLKYERINPNFISLGTLHFRNDFENVSIGYRGTLAKRIAMSGRLGIERNNLDDQEIENRNRFIGAFQANISVSDNWQNSFSYSNFRQTTRLIDNSNPFEPIDSIFLGSVNNQFGLSSSIKINPVQRMLFNFSHQRANSIVNDQITQATSKVNNVAANYHISQETGKLSAGVSLLWNGLIQASVRTSVITPALQINHKMSEKVTNSFSISNNFTRINRKGNGGILRGTLGSQFRISKKQRLTMQLQYLNRSGAIANNFIEFNGQVGYSMSF